MEDSLSARCLADSAYSAQRQTDTTQPRRNEEMSVNLEPGHTLGFHRTCPLSLSLSARTSAAYKQQEADVEIAISRRPAHANGQADSNDSEPQL